MRTYRKDDIFMQRRLLPSFTYLPTIICKDYVSGSHSPCVMVDGKFAHCDYVNCLSVNLFMWFWNIYYYYMEDCDKHSNFIIQYLYEIIYHWYDENHINIKQIRKNNASINLIVGFAKVAPQTPWLPALVVLSIWFNKIRRWMFNFWETTAWYNY